MCAVSMISDHYMRKWPQPSYVPTFEEYWNYKELIRIAAEYDKTTKQPECPIQDKIDWQKKLDAAFNTKYQSTYSFGPHTVFNATE